MIPLRLRLRNFMCYRDNVPPLLLEGVHVACLCGENGAGKSALLDAITWALWGSTSRGKLEDELIAIGKDEMEVELEFLVGDARYRVVRKRARTIGRRAGHTLLELHSFSGSMFVPVTANSTTETQRKITDALRMDFTTFINSAFLVQGRANEFAMRTPDERKKVLGKILNLEYYERLEQRARDESRRRRDIVAVLDMAARDLERELARREEFQAKVREAEERLIDSAKVQKQRQAEIEALRDAKQALDVKERQAAEVRARVLVLDAEVAKLRLRLAESDKECARVQEVVSNERAIAAGYARFLEAAAERETLDAKAGPYMALNLEIHALELATTGQRSKLETDLRVRESRLHDTQALSAGRMKVAADLQAADRDIEDLKKAEERGHSIQVLLQAQEGEAGGLTAANGNLLLEIAEIKTLQDQFALGQGVCPLCGTPLSEGRCDDVLVGYEAKGKVKATAIRANRTRLATLTEEGTRLRQELATLEQKLRLRRAGLMASAGTLRASLNQAQAAETETPALQLAIAEIQRRLMDKDYAHAEIKALAAKKMDLAKLAYDRAAHDQARRAFDLAKPAEALHRQLEEAKRRAPDELHRREELLADVAHRQQGAAAEKAALDQLAVDLAGLPRMTLDLQAKELDFRTLTQQAEALNIALGGARAELTRLEAAERGLREKREARAAAADEQGVYEDLVRAFGRGGVQALLIDSAIPEIEEEANRLLGRMTDNRMHLKLETQEPLRTRDALKETLDIKISDELGTRSYETFSGGEAFRINVALRIALSRLLARRVGAPLPTLFIDEGFGTQDAAGREKVVETITAIQDEFQRILIITHIDELKEQFPVRIEVAKTTDGSTFAIV